MSVRFKNPEVKAVFDAYGQKVKNKLLAVRELIFAVANNTLGVGELEETLKWGQPSYVTAESKSGSLVRIDAIKSNEHQYAVYFHCQTSLIGMFRQLYPDTFTFEGNRALIFDVRDTIPKKELAHCIGLALTYNFIRKSKLPKRITRKK